MSAIVQDIRFCLRQLQRAPAFALAAVLTLAVGIGANTAVFTVVDNVLLAPLPYRTPNKIVAIQTKLDREGRQSTRVTGGDAVDLATQKNVFDAFSLYWGGDMGVQLKDHATFTNVSLVNADFVRVFGVQPVVGRGFQEQEAPTSAIVRESFAQNNFGSAQAAMGQTISMEGTVYTITGVMPNNFDFPHATQVWLGSSATPTNLNRTGYNYRAVARLRDEVSRESALAQLSALSKSLEEQYPDTNSGKHFIPVALQEQLVGKTRPMLLMLMAAVGIVLIIACANLVNLQLARATTRYREIAVRGALGASRGAVARLIIVESVVLAVIGAALGILIAVPVLHAVISAAPEGIPRLSEVHVNPVVLAFTFLVALLASVVSGLAAAVQLWRVDLVTALKQDAARGLSSGSVTRIRAVLITSEVALTVVLAIAAGLLVRTMQQLNSTTLGFSTDRMLVTYAHAPAKTEPELIARSVQFEKIFSDLAATPGVERVAGVMGLPTGAYGSNGYYEVEGVTEPMMSLEGPEATFSLASPGYFGTVGIPLLRGREFAETDRNDSDFVAIISQSVAKQVFGDRNPIGMKIRCGFDTLKWMTVVGIVGDVRQDSPASQPGPALYMPLKQHVVAANEIEIVSRTAVAPASLIDTFRQKIHAADSSIATKFTTMDDLVGESVAVHRFRSYLLGSFALLGFGLAMLGVYGVMAYSVAQRTFEVGVRMTFGADRADILKLVLAQAAKLTAIGIAIGLVISVVATRSMSSMLYGVRPRDPLTMTIGIVLIAIAALLAAYIPAQRAATVDPLTAIRHE